MLGGPRERSGCPPPSGSFTPPLCGLVLLRRSQSEGGHDENGPHRDVEATLEALLKKILRVSRVGRHDNFFDLGGHSLLAVQYFYEIQNIYGIRLPLATLFRAGTVAQLAIEIQNWNEAENHVGRCLVPIQSQGVKPKFFCVHGAGGNVLFYRHLSKLLGEDVPFYGLQSRGLDGSAEPLSSVEDMAEAYVAEITTVQASGPYYLGGYCLGGTIAFEMAQQLQRAGQEVALPALLDAYNFATMESYSYLGYLVQNVLPQGSWTVV